MQDQEKGARRNRKQDTHWSSKVRTSIHVVRGRLSFSLYVGRITEYLRAPESGSDPVCDRVTTMAKVQYCCNKATESKTRRDPRYPLNISNGWCRNLSDCCVSSFQLGFRHVILSYTVCCCVVWMARTRSAAKE